MGSRMIGGTKETRMERREFVEKIGLGSAVALVTGGAIVAGAGSSGATTEKAAAQHQHDPVKGPLAAATVTFGSWRTDLSVDRFPNVSSAAANAHQVIPHQVTIKAGGSVAFVISDLHQILISDPANRVYGGLDPTTQPRDRVEAVNFYAEGKYLVVCGVQSHFVNDQMYGWVRVLPADSD